MKNRPEFKESLMVPDPYTKIILPKFEGDIRLLLFIDEFLGPKAYVIKVYCLLDFLKLLANALRHNNYAALIDIFEIEHGPAEKLINAYRDRCKNTMKHVRVVNTKYNHLKQFKDTKEIQEFEFRNPADPPFHKNAKCHSIPFTPYQDEE